MIDITKVDKAELLAELHNNTRAIGMGQLHDLGRNMTVAEAQWLIDQTIVKGYDLYFDYLFGRPIKVDLGRDVVDEFYYDELAGPGTLARIVEELRRTY